MSIASPASPAMGLVLHSESTPSFSLPMRYFALGLVGYVAATAAMAFDAGELASGSGTWTPHLLAVTHLVALGFVVPVIIGASFQLVPVVLLARIWSEGLGKLAFWPYAVGVVALVTGFWTWTPLALATGGTLVVAGVGLVLLDLAVSLVRGHEGGPVAHSFCLAMTALVLAGLAGLARAIGFAYPELAVPLAGAVPAHAGLAAIGCATVLIFGVSYRLVPMFAVAPEQDPLAVPVLALTGAGVAALAAGHLAGVQLAAAVGAGAIALGTTLWLIDQARLFRSKRRKLDAGLTYVAAALPYLAATAALGLGLAWGGLSGARWELTYAALGLVGWIGFSIHGYLHKILPFLAWYHRYSALVGVRKVPLIREMYSEKLAWLGFWGSQAGLLSLVVAIATGLTPLVFAGAALLAAGGLASLAIAAQCLTR